jgi:hypothetical protein
MPKEKKPPPETSEPEEPAAITVHCHHDRLADPASLRFNPANDNKHPEDQLRRIVTVFREIGIATRSSSAAAAAWLSSVKAAPAPRC